MPLKEEDMDFPGGPVVKTLPCNAGGVGSIHDQGAKVLHTSRTTTATTKKPAEKQNINNRSNIVTNSIKTLKMVHVKKFQKRREQKLAHCLFTMWR